MIQEEDPSTLKVEPPTINSMAQIVFGCFCVDKVLNGHTGLYGLFWCQGICDQSDLTPLRQILPSPPHKPFLKLFNHMISSHCGLKS